MCNNYFVLRSDTANTVRYDNMANIFCSKICASLFLLKYRSMVECAFCSDQNYNFYMVKVVSNRGTDEMPFCSRSCLDLFTETENAVLVTFNDDALKEHRQTEYREFVPKLPVKKERQTKGKTTVATQTDFVCDCKCNKENTRTKLVPVKRLAKDTGLQQEIKQEFAPRNPEKNVRAKTIPAKKRMVKDVGQTLQQGIKQELRIVQQNKLPRSKA